MIPFDGARDDDAELQYRRLTIGHALTELSIARAQELDEARLAVYTNALLDLDVELVIAACQDLAKQKRQEGETAMPSVGDIRDRCWQIRANEQRAEEERAAEEAYHRKRDVLPQARRAQLDGWLKASIQAIQHGHRRPPCPVRLLDSADVTYQCATCHDTGFHRVCTCQQRHCDDCRWQRVVHCHCRPAAPPPTADPKPTRRGTGWTRAARDE